MGCVALNRRCGYCLLEVLADVLGRRQVVLAEAAATAAAALAGLLGLAGLLLAGLVARQAAAAEEGEAAAAHVHLVLVASAAAKR